MKKTICITVLAVIIILGCKKKTTTTATNTTPPPPTTVTNQMIFTVNGGTTYTATTDAVFTNQLTVNGGTSTSNNIEVTLNMPKSVGTYTLNLGLSADYVYTDNNNNFQNYQTDATHTGTVSVTQCDTINRKVSGKFSFNGFHSTIGSAGTPTVSITNGSFTNVSF
ncbi:MAG TPA: hypothetical protein VKG26_13685 [Bacteroidia bacterium]|nr:hypothetical protein [Bacteroidia bacterium]